MPKEISNESVKVLENQNKEIIEEFNLLKKQGKINVDQAQKFETLQHKVNNVSNGITL